MTTNFKILEGEKFGGSDVKNLRKALMESKDAVEARDGITKMAHQFENSPENQREAMLKKSCGGGQITERVRFRTFWHPHDS